MTTFIVKPHMVTSSLGLQPRLLLDRPRSERGRWGKHAQLCGVVSSRPCSSVSACTPILRQPSRLVQVVFSFLGLQNFPNLLVDLLLDGVRSRPRMNHAVFCVTPISFPSCRLEMPLRAVTSKYMLYSHLWSGTFDRSKMVLVRIVKSKAQPRQR